MTYGTYCKVGAPDTLWALMWRLSARRAWKMKHRLDRIIRQQFKEVPARAR